MDEQTRGLIRGTLTDVRYAEAESEDFELVVYENLMQPLEQRIAETDTKARGYEQETYRLLNEREELRRQLAEAQTIMDAVWEMMDGLYGGNGHEELPINTLTADRRRACDEALILLGQYIHRPPAPE